MGHDGVRFGLASVLHGRASWVGIAKSELENRGSPTAVHGIQLQYCWSHAAAKRGQLSIAIDSQRLRTVEYQTRKETKIHIHIAGPQERRLDHFCLSATEQYDGASSDATRQVDETVYSFQPKTYKGKRGYRILPSLGQIVRFAAQQRILDWEV